MFCQNCGKQVPDTASFCHYCGARKGQVIEETAPVEEFRSVQIPIQVPVSVEPQMPAAEFPESVPAEPQMPAVEFPEPEPAEPQISAAELSEPESAEPQMPAVEVPEPESAEPQVPAVAVMEPESAEPQMPAVEVPEPEPAEPQMPAVAVMEPEPPAEAPQPETSGSEQQTDDQSDKKNKRKVIFYMIRTGFLTALVSILLIPCTAAFFVLLFLNALTEKMDFPALGGIGQSIVNNVLGSELSIVLLGVVCLLLMLDIIFINRKCVRRAWLALGMSLFIVGLISFGLSFAVTFILNHLVAEWHMILLPAATAFSQSEMLFGIGWCVIGAALFSIHLCIRALRKKPNIRLDRRSKVFPVIMVLLHISTALAVEAGVLLIVSGSVPF